jgi:hypothetical protein
LTFAAGTADLRRARENARARKSFKRARGRRIAAWARIEARSYEEALALLEQLSAASPTIVQSDELTWSIYISAESPEYPTVIFDARKVSLIEDDLSCCEVKPPGRTMR